MFENDCFITFYLMPLQLQNKPALSANKKAAHVCFPTLFHSKTPLQFITNNYTYLLKTEEMETNMLYLYET